nr:reverse transcriptase domain-containing protein [Tanacetum cinerariifolium]
MVISSALSTVEKARILEVLKNHKGVIAWSITGIKEIDLSFCTYKILMEDKFKPSVQPQRRVNPNLKEDEMRLDAYESSISYKERTKRWHDKRIKAPTNYERGDKDMKNGAIKLYDEYGNEYIVNKQRVKPYQKSILDTNRDDDITLDDEREVTYCPISRTAKQLEEICNFKQERDETLYQAWEQYNDLLYKCPTHDINNHQKTMVDHSQKWHDGSSSRSIKGSSFEGIAPIMNKLENLGRDMKKIKENVHAIQVGCQTYEGAHLDKDCPLNEEVKGMEEVKYGEFRLTVDLIKEDIASPYQEKRDPA